MFRRLNVEPIHPATEHMHVIVRFEQIREFLHRDLGANYGDDRVLVSSHGVVIAHFYLTSERRIKAPDEGHLERHITELAATKPR